MRTHYWESRQALTPSNALEFLKEGNQRFVNNLRINHNLLQLVNETAEKQFTIAAILSCSDSRVPVELVFDQGLGDIFSIRLAGNIASQNAVGSMEYACKILGSKLLVIMGHTNCGAVKAACDGFKMDNLDLLLSHIHPAVDAENETLQNRQSGNKRFLSNVTNLSVQHQLKTILDTSPIIREMLLAGEISLVGAVYDVETGRVNFMDDQTQLILQNEKLEIYQR